MLQVSGCARGGGQGERGKSESGEADARAAQRANGKPRTQARRLGARGGRAAARGAQAGGGLSDGNSNDRTRTLAAGGALRSPGERLAPVSATRAFPRRGEARARLGALT